MAQIKLFESWLQSQAINELAPHGTLEMGWLDSVGGVVQNFNENQNLCFERIKTLLDRNGIKFARNTEVAAAAFASLYFIVAQQLPQWRDNLVKGVDVWFKKGTDIKLMDSPEDPNLVLTTGQFLTDRINNPGDDSQSSNYALVAEYCNNATLIRVLQFLNEKASRNSAAYLPGAGYALSLAPETNSVQWARQGEYQMKLYGTAVTTSAASKQAVTTTTWEVPATGKTIVKKLPGTMFATGSATLSDSKELDSAIAELAALLADKNTKLAKIEVESSASGDKPVDGVSGYPKGSAAGAYPMGTPYIPKAATESANAKLAFDRAEAIKAKLTTLGAPTTVKALIQDGGDAAQYAKLIVTVQKTDKPAETLTKTDLETILLKPKQTTGLASTKTLSVWTIATNENGAK